MVKTCLKCIFIRGTLAFQLVQSAICFFYESNIRYSSPLGPLVHPILNKNTLTLTNSLQIMSGQSGNVEKENKENSEGLVDIGSTSLFDENSRETGGEFSAPQKTWIQELNRALAQHRRQPQARYVQLATCGASRFPSCRTVVFRGFADFCAPQRGIIKFITDLRSEKIKDIEANPSAEVCWYFDKTREQFRIQGNLVLIKHDETDAKLARAREVQWKNLSDNARLQFAWPVPGKERHNSDDDEADFNPPNPSATEPLDTFCLLLLEPIGIDHLQLKANPQQRALYSLEADGKNSETVTWNYIRVNP